MTGWTATWPLPGLSDAARARLDTLHVAEVHKGTVLFRPGDEPSGFVLLLDGRIDVFLTGASGREILLYSVSPGQSCVQTTLGLLSGDTYTGEAVTASPVRVVMVPRPLFLNLMEQDPGFRDFVFRTFATRMQSMMHLLETVAFTRVEARLARCLLDRAQHGVVLATHAEIAAMIGTAREVVSRQLEALSRRGMVRLERGAVHLDDAPSLENLARSAEM